MFLIAITAILLALIIGVIIEVRHLLRKRKLNKARQAANLEAFNHWLETRVVDNADLQHRLAHYKIDSKL